MSEQAPQSISTDEVRKESAHLRRQHNDAVSARDLNQNYAKAEGHKRSFLEDTIKTIRSAENGQESAGLAAVREQLVEVRQNEHESLYSADNSDTSRKAALWDAHEDLSQNREAYEQAAIEDANAAGHDVQFGGQNYPAQPAEQPKPAQQ
jgi:benzoyl-CoA reductase/2-hydroxyglutaryl-CoA dehydratase subunit BcrC/BadD/HgdB